MADNFIVLFIYLFFFGFSFFLLFFCISWERITIKIPLFSHMKDYVDFLAWVSIAHADT